MKETFKVEGVRWVPEAVDFVKKEFEGGDPWYVQERIVELFFNEQSKGNGFQVIYQLEKRQYWIDRGCKDRYEFRFPYMGKKVYCYIRWGPPIPGTSRHKCRMASLHWDTSNPVPYDPRFLKEGDE